jgi:hypothetical protein
LFFDGFEEGETVVLRTDGALPQLHRVLLVHQYAFAPVCEVSRVAKTSFSLQLDGAFSKGLEGLAILRRDDVDAARVRRFLGKLGEQITPEPQPPQYEVAFFEGKFTGRNIHYLSHFFLLNRKCGAVEWLRHPTGAASIGLR